MRSKAGAVQLDRLDRLILEGWGDVPADEDSARCDGDGGARLLANGGARSIRMSKPLCIDLFCGLGGWTVGFLEAGYRVVGFDVERHEYAVPDGTSRTRIIRYPSQLVLQDVLTIHGSQFQNADCIVASPPCQEYSFMAMPFSRGKQIAAALRGEGEFPEGYTGSRTVAQLTALFDSCFRIQREACAAAGRYIPLVVENVKGAQPWVGKAKAHYGSFFLWGDVGSLGGRIVAGGSRFGGGLAAGGGVKGQGGAWFNDYKKRKEAGGNIARLSCTSSKSMARKAASAQIAKIPFPLASYIAMSFRA